MTRGYGLHVEEAVPLMVVVFGDKGEIPTLNGRLVLKIRQRLKMGVPFVWLANLSGHE